MQKQQERKGGQQGGQRRDQQKDRNRQPGHGQPQPDRFAQDEEFERKDEFDDEESSQPTRPGHRPNA